jgi:GNAT superfamily N-acetyltransferase
MDSRFQVRALMHHDYDDIHRIAIENWEGEDYLPHVFYKWLEDPGLLIGIEETHINQIVALAHVALLPDGTAWLEGLRVRSDFRNLGLSKIMMEHQIDYAKDLLHKGTITRIASSTYIKNDISIHLSISHGFRLYGSYLILTWNPDGDMEEAVDIHPWDPTWDEIISLPYFSDTKQHIIQFFQVQQANEKWWNETKGDLSFFIINGFKGWIDERVEPHCVVLEPTRDSIINWLHFTSFRIGKDASTVIYPKDALVEDLKKTNLLPWTDWIPDCLYFVYDPQ